MIKVEVTEGGEFVERNSLHLEGADVRCEGEAVVQWVVEIKEEGDVKFESAEEDDPLCLPQNDLLNKDFETTYQNERGKSKRRATREMSPGCEYERIREANIAEKMEVLQMLDIGAAVAGDGSICSRKSSGKAKRDGQIYNEAKVRSSRHERGRRGSHGNSLEEVKSQGRELAVKYWERPLDQGTIRDIMGGEEGPVEKEKGHQKEGGRPSGARKLGVGFKVVGDFELKALLMKRNESRKHKKIRRACGMCKACRTDNCGACKYCQDMIRFGGRGVLKQKCMLRACEDPKI